MPSWLLPDPELLAEAPVASATSRVGWLPWALFGALATAVCLFGLSGALRAVLVALGALFLLGVQAAYGARPARIAREGGLGRLVVLSMTASILVGASALGQLEFPEGLLVPRRHYLDPRESLVIGCALTGLAALATARADVLGPRRQRFGGAAVIAAVGLTASAWVSSRWNFSFDFAEPRGDSFCNVSRLVTTGLAGWSSATLRRAVRAVFGVPRLFAWLAAFGAIGGALLPRLIRRFELRNDARPRPRTALGATSLVVLAVGLVLAGAAAKRAIAVDAQASPKAYFEALPIAGRFRSDGPPEGWSCSELVDARCEVWRRIFDGVEVRAKDHRRWANIYLSIGGGEPLCFTPGYAGGEVVRWDARLRALVVASDDRLCLVDTRRGARLSPSLANLAKSLSPPRTWVALALAAIGAASFLRLRRSRADALLTVRAAWVEGEVAAEHFSAPDGRAWKVARADDGPAVLALTPVEGETYRAGTEIAPEVLIRSAAPALERACVTSARRRSAAVITIVLVALAPLVVAAALGMVG